MLVKSMSTKSRTSRNRSYSARIKHQQQQQQNKPFLKQIGKKEAVLNGFESTDESNSSMQSNSNSNTNRNKANRRIESTQRRNSIESTASSTNTLTNGNSHQDDECGDDEDDFNEADLVSNPPSRFSSSSSLIDLFTLVFRYKDACQSLIEIVIPNEWLKHNQKFFQAKFNCINNMFQVEQKISLKNQVY